MFGDKNFPITVCDSSIHDDFNALTILQGKLNSKDLPSPSHVKVRVKVRVEVCACESMS
jgi:hypothetical protein